MARASESLTREQIAEAALTLVNRDGLEALTMRKLADELDVSPPAVYRHFEDKAAIVRGIVEHILRSHALPNARELGWRRWLFETFVRTRRELGAQAATLPLLASTDLFSEHAVRVADEILGVLLSAGLEPRDAATSFRLLMSYTIGQTVLGSPEKSALSTPTALEIFEAHPNVLACAPFLGSTDEAFAAGLDALLDQVASKL